MRDVQTGFFQMAAVLLLALLHANRYVGLFLIWIVAQFLFFRNMGIESYTLQNVFFGAVIYHFIVKYSKTSELKKYYWVFVAILILNIVWCFRQMAQADPIFHLRNYQFQTLFSDYPGFFALPAFLGNYVAPVIPLLFALNYWLLPVGLLGIYFSKSTFSAMACLAAMLFFFWFRKRLVFWATLAVLGTGFLFYAIKFDLPTGQFERRIKVWHIIEQLAFRKPFFGYGIGKLQDFWIIEALPTHNLIATDRQDKLKMFLIDNVVQGGHPELVDFIKHESDFRKIQVEINKYHLDFEKWNEAHNEFLQVFFETGLLGLLIIVFYVMDLFRRFLLYGRRNLHCLVLMASFVAILVCSFGHFPFHLARLAGPYIVLMAFLDLSLLRAQKAVEDII